MSDRIIICISREYGSGGQEIGEKLAAKLGIKCYNKVLIDNQTAQDYGVPADIIATFGEKKPISWIAQQSPLRSEYYDTVFYVINDDIFNLQSKTIKKIASKESCVIVGRVADEILKDDPDMLSIFIHSKMENRIKRVMETENKSFENAERELKLLDKSRAKYYNHYSNRKWGVCDSYDLSISSSKFGIDGVVAIINKFINELKDV